MSLLFRERRASSPASPLIPSRPPVGSWAGVAVSPDSAQRLAAVWGSVRVIADAIATMPWVAFRGDGSDRQEVTPQPSLLMRPASGNRPRVIGWRRALVHSLLLRGNAYGVVSGADAMGRNPQRVDLVSPDRVQWVPRRDGWEVRLDNKPRDLWPIGDLWHVTAHEVAGLPFGLNPVEHAAQLIGVGLAAEKFGAQFFADGGHPSAIIRSNAPLDQQQAAAIKDAFIAATTGNRAPAVMGAGLEYVKIQIDPKDSQFLDSQKFTAQQICGAIFGVPPEMLGFASSGESLTYANIVDRDLFLLKYGLSPWIARIQEAMTELLPQPQFVRFNTGALLRADAKGRADTYLTLAQVGQTLGQPVVTADQIRALEDWEPIDA